MKKYLIICFVTFVLWGLAFVKQTDEKTDKVLSDENLLPEIALIESVFPNQEVSLKSDSIDKNGNIISLIFIIESKNDSLWASNARYEITSLARHPNHQEIQYYWSLRNDELRVYDDEKCDVFLLSNRNANDGAVHCIVGRLDNESTSIYFISYIKEEYIQSDLIGEIEKVKKLFKN